MNKKKISYLFLAVVLFLLAATVGSLCLGAASLRPLQIWKAVQMGAAGGYEGHIFWYVRLPRTIACLLAGAGLSVSGVIIQAVLANPLASSNIIGVNAGAGMAVTLCCACGVVSGWMIAGAAFAGALFAVMIVAVAAQKLKASRTTVILGGVAVNSFFTAVSEMITTLIPEAGTLSAEFRVGGFSSISHLRLIPAGMLILAGLAVVMTLSTELDVMNLGDETAQSLGLSVKRMRTIFLVLAALLAGASVSFAGILGFVGLIVPHTMQKLAGSESRCLIPLCALGGAGFVTVCDTLSRVLFMPYELPVGILISFIGGPFFVWMIVKRRTAYPAVRSGFERKAKKTEQRMQCSVEECMTPAEQSCRSLIKLEAVCSGYDHQEVLRKITIQADAGKVTVLAGSNGCGKSTVLKTLMGIAEKSEGEIWIAEKRMEEYRPEELAQKIAYFAQNHNVPEISARGMVLHGRFPYLNYPRRYRKTDLAAAENALQRVGMEAYAETNMNQLSGGMQQKIYLAMVLAQDTPVVLLDEPTSFLDISCQMRLMETAKQLAAQGKAVLLVLHDLPLALRTADQLFVLQDGTVRGSGTPEEIWKSGVLEEVFGVKVRGVQTETGWQYYCVDVEETFFR